MRTMFVSLIPSYWGGSEVLWSKTAAVLRKRGQPVGVFFAMFRDAPAIDSLKRAGVQFFFGTPAPERWWRRWARKIALRKPTVRERYLNALATFRPELVIFSQCAVCDGLEEMQICHSLGIPYAVINQLVEPLYYSDERWRQIDSCYKHALKVWFVSKENRESVRVFLGRGLPNAEVIPNAYDC